MPQLTFNSFEFYLARHQESFNFTAAISSSAPRGHNIDRMGKKMPTPYILFQKWASRSLSGEWATRKYKGGFIICVADMKAATLIAQTFGSAGPLKKTTSGERNVLLGYKDAHYNHLATKLGYDI